MYSWDKNEVVPAKGLSINVKVKAKDRFSFDTVVLCVDDRACTIAPFLTAAQSINQSAGIVEPTCSTTCGYSNFEEK